jgi:hypothetical protein
VDEIPEIGEIKGGMLEAKDSPQDLIWGGMTKDYSATEIVGNSKHTLIPTFFY